MERRRRILLILAAPPVARLSQARGPYHTAATLPVPLRHPSNPYLDRVLGLYLYIDEVLKKWATSGSLAIRAAPYPPFRRSLTSDPQ